MLTSSLVLVVRRESGDAGLLQTDRDFVSQVVIPRLHEIVGIPMPRQEADEDASATESKPLNQLRQDVMRISFTD